MSAADLILFTLIAAVMSVLNIDRDRLEKQTFVAHIRGTALDTVMVYNRGSYFCPAFCLVDHRHLSHTVEYECGLNYCDHLIFNLKKGVDAINSPLPLASVE